MLHKFEDVPGTNPQGNFPKSGHAAILVLRSQFPRSCHVFGVAYAASVASSGVIPELGRNVWHGLRGRKEDREDAWRVEPCAVRRCRKSDPFQVDPVGRSGSKSITRPGSLRELTIQFGVRPMSISSSEAWIRFGPFCQFCLEQTFSTSPSMTTAVAFLPLHCSL